MKLLRKKKCDLFCKKTQNVIEKTYFWHQKWWKKTYFSDCWLKNIKIYVTLNDNKFCWKTYILVLWYWTWRKTLNLTLPNFFDTCLNFKFIISHIQIASLTWKKNPKHILRWIFDMLRVFWLSASPTQASRSFFRVFFPSPNSSKHWNRQQIWNAANKIEIEANDIKSGRKSHCGSKGQGTKFAELDPRQ